MSTLETKCARCGHIQAMHDVDVDDPYADGACEIEGCSCQQYEDPAPTP